MSRGGGDYGSEEGVKVVIIDTHYVKTDPTSFKSVVQRLTGKDSAACGHHHDVIKRRPQRSTVAAADVQSGGGGVAAAGVNRNNRSFNSEDNMTSSASLRAVSFSDLDKLLLELPSLDELLYDRSDQLLAS